MARRRHRVSLRKKNVRYRFGLFLYACCLWSLWIGVAGLIVAGGTYAYKFWLESPYFRVQAVTFDPALPPDLVRQFSLTPGDHFFRYSSATLEKNLTEDFPELKQIRVVRRWDRSVHVKAVRRIPLACSVDKNRWKGVDEDGVVFPIRGTEWDVQRIPMLVEGAPHRYFSTVFRVFKEIRLLPLDWTNRIRKIKIVSPDEVWFFLQDGTEVFWGGLQKETFRKKAERLERVLADEILKPSGVEYARFVDDRRIVVKPRGKDREWVNQKS
ncbi:MAG TPA: cell division protein FtsQ/DivIB [Elusimicrobiota bacterium]|nr:cell division protein FtsQ/DivIB [Elusimicrobiota bacterium]